MASCSDSENSKTPRAENKINNDSDGAVRQPVENCKWTLEILRTLVISYEDTNSLSELLDRFPVSSPEKKRTQYFLFNHKKQIEKFFKEYCHFHLCLDDKFHDLPRTTSDVFRGYDGMYTTKKYLDVMDASTEMHTWFKR